MAYAIVGSLTDGDVDPVGVAIFLVAVLVLHDAVFLPLVLAGGALIRRVVPVRWRSTVRAVAIVDLAVVVVALPLMIGLGAPYGLGLLLILLVTPAVRKWKGTRRAPRG
ncbi:hypothetical protein [Paractinoplanes deccanensis]|nr:hypothetical protein [Actinoplanes deccanensis]